MAANDGVSSFLMMSEVTRAARVDSRFACAVQQPLGDSGQWHHLNATRSPTWKAWSKSIFGGLEVAPASDHVFILPVESVSDDRKSVKVRLCARGSLDVPIAALKSARRMGQIQVDSEKFEVASGEIDRSSSSGRLLQQVAIELGRVAGTLPVIRGGAPEPATPIAPRPLDYNLTPTTIKNSFTGAAGQPVTITYTAPEYQYLFTKNISFLDYIGNHVTFGNCRLADPDHLHSGFTEIVTPGGLRVVNGIVLYLEAPPNTPLGRTYFASVGIGVTLVQETT